MRRSIFHIIVILLLAVLYIGERAVPCVEVGADDCAANSHAAVSAVSGYHGEDHHDPAPSEDGTHHCDHCSCPCHIPALSLPGERIPAAIHSQREYSAVVYLLASASVHPPDHIPLA